MKTVTNNITYDKLKDLCICQQQEIRHLKRRLCQQLRREKEVTVRRIDKARFKSGLTVNWACWMHNIGVPTYYQWKKKQIAKRRKNT